MCHDTDMKNRILKERYSPVDALKQLLGTETHIPDREYAGLSASFVLRDFPAKHTLVRAGDLWDRIFYIHQGILRLFYIDPDGKEFNKGFFTEGQFLWPVAPSARQKTSLFSIAALEPLTLSVCGFSRFHDWLAWQGAWERFALPMAEAFAEEKFLREYEFLIHSPADRYLAFCKDHPALAERLPDYHLASYLGITNVSLSRIKSRIKSKKK